jgi:HAD superfamily hydrolase (TIGR01450 family)
VAGDRDVAGTGRGSASSDERDPARADSDPARADSDPARAGAPTGAGARPLVERYDAVLLDLDGVLYLVDRPVPHAAAAVARARAAGLRVAFVTNNASRSPAAVAAHLVQLGIDAEPGDVVTSAQAAARVVAAQVPAGSPVLVVGAPALEEQVRDVGLRPVRTCAQAGRDGPAAVVQGLSPDTAWRDLAEAAAAVRSGAVWVAGNADSTLPSPRGALPGNGTFVEAVRTATGAQPIVAGKPEPALHEEALRRLGARRPLVVGDRLDTDIAGAVRVRADSLLVLTGVTDLSALLQAPPACRPSFVGRDLRALHVSHPHVRRDGDHVRCAGAVAHVDRDGVVQVELPGGAPAGGDADVAGDVALLRATCAAAWSAADAGRIVRGAALPTASAPPDPAAA